MKSPIVTLAAFALLARGAFGAGSPALPSIQDALADSRAAARPIVSAPVVAPAEREGTDEEIVAAVCRSADPVAVVDQFTGDPDDKFDLDGDNVYDAFHGEIVASFYRASGKSVVPVDVFKFNALDFVTIILERFVARLERGEFKVSAINLSLAADIPAAELGTLPSPSEPRAERERLHSKVQAWFTSRGSDYGAFVALMERARRLGVAVIVPAGNSGPGKVNALSLLPGAITVGGLTIDGRKSESTGDNALVGIWRLGERVMRRTADGGVDVNGDGTAEFPRSSLSGGPAWARYFTGRLVSETVIDPPTGGDFDVLNRAHPAGLAALRRIMPDALYRTEDAIRYFKKEGLFAAAMRRRGEYYDKHLTMPFRADSNGRIVFDPAGDGSPNQVTILNGTSVAAPAICLPR
ncbi:MAG: hypothetical protein HY078_16030 [Elusimicrobia bacterium]|nr:hypothetical protein [Elusimicrobiota bacterium]